MSQNLFGCDLSKARIDIHDRVAGRDFAIENRTATIAPWLVELPDNARVIFEATSGCDGALIAALCAAGVRFSRVNPRQAREFAKASGVLAKSDRVDARVLAEMGARLDLPDTRPPDPARQFLAGKLKRRQQLVSMRQSEKLRRADADDPEIVAEIDDMIAIFSARVRKLEAEIERLTRDDPELAPDAAILRSMPGIGPNIAAQLLALLPELGHTDRRRIASLVGLAPLARDSGTMRGKRSIWGGRKLVRRALYIAALNAARCAPEFKSRYERLRAAGKAAKTAHIAIARQMLVTLNAMIRDGKMYQPANA